MRSLFFGGGTPSSAVWGERYATGKTACQTNGNKMLTAWRIGGDLSRPDVTPFDSPMSTAGRLSNWYLHWTTLTAVRTDLSVSSVNVGLLVHLSKANITEDWKKLSFSNFYMKLIHATSSNASHRRNKLQQRLSNRIASGYRQVTQLVVVVSTSLVGRKFSYM